MSRMWESFESRSHWLRVVQYLDNTQIIQCTAVKCYDIVQFTCYLKLSLLWSHTLFRLLISKGPKDDTK